MNRHAIDRAALRPAESDDEAEGILRAEAASILQRVRDPWVGLALWCRRMPTALTDVLDAMPPERLPHGRVLTTAGDLDAALDWLLDAAGQDGTALGDFLHADIRRLADLFAEVAGTNIIDLRLETIRHDACWKFHRDNTRLRLITTYRGPSTQIVPIDAAAWALREQRGYSGPIEELPRFSVALFKGIRASRAEGGVVHRSPPIAGTGQSRLVLCLNERSEASPPLRRG